MDKGLMCQSCKIQLTLVPEFFRLAGYLGFCLTFLVCIVITKLTRPEFILDNSVMKVFGYNNVCVFFDSTPARYWGLLLCNLNCAILIVYGMLCWVRMHQAYKQVEGIESSAVYWVYTLFIVLECVAYSCFCLVFTALS